MIEIRRVNYKGKQVKNNVGRTMKDKRQELTWDYKFILRREDEKEAN